MSEGRLGRFGDHRLASVGDALLASMRQHRTVCVQRLAKDRSQLIQFSRFLGNPAVSVQEMLCASGQQTGFRAAGRHVLAIQDTTELHFPTHTGSKRGFGKGGNGQDLGLFLHPLLAVDAANGGVIGLLDCQVMNRTAGKVSSHKQREADDKESRRWLLGAEMAAERLTDAAMVTVVADRESDVYDLFARRPETVHLLCRSAQDRALVDGGLLADRCAGWAEQDLDTITVPARPGQKEREATVSLRFGAVTLRRPDTKAAKGLPGSLTLWVVDVQEAEPPDGCTAIRWRLLTTHAVTSVAEARQIVGWYRLRWTIEQVFRALKTHGLSIEEAQTGDVRGFTKLAMVALIAAVEAMQLVLARNGDTGQAVTDAVEADDMPALRSLNTSLEGRTAALKNPHSEVSLAWLAWIAARLGGWSGYTSRGYKPPGPKTMHHGLLRLQPILQGWRLASRSGHV
jgi:hypothetical protein